MQCKQLPVVSEVDLEVNRGRGWITSSHAPKEASLLHKLLENDRPGSRILIHMLSSDCAIPLLLCEGKTYIAVVAILCLKGSNCY